MSYIALTIVFQHHVTFKQVLLLLYLGWRFWDCKSAGINFIYDDQDHDWNTLLPVSRTAF